MNNIHPLLVHFPVALLSFYAVLEIISFKKVRSIFWIFYVKAVLVIGGFIGGLLASSSGEAIEHNFPMKENLIEIHSFWAGTTNVIFGIIAVVYLIVWIHKSNIIKLLPETVMGKIWRMKVMVAEKILYARSMMLILAMAGIIAVTITGALGASIVYGPEIDPIVKFIYTKLIGV